jgi:cytochrome c5
MIRAILLFVVFSLAACDSKHAAAPEAKLLEQAATLTPSDARLASMYTQSCKLCHTTQGSLAPLTGDRAAWNDRWQKGMPALLQSVVIGLNGMPPGGQCFACSPADYEALIKFMAMRDP